MGKVHRNSLKPGYKLHWYEIKEILGQGGFGITYLAHDTNLDEDVAIKEYLPIELAVREGDFSVHPVSDGHMENYRWGLDRFIAEARTLTKFKHPNIVRVRNVFEENNTAYMVMEYEHGQSLQQKLEGRKTMEEPDLIKLIIPILGGLELVHSEGFIHRDIKPDNIYLRRDGSPVLLDFGSARQALGEQTKTLTSLVTPGYAPFEQYYSKSDEQGPWTDIYGLGATLYRAISGIAPINAVDRSKAILNTGKDTFVSAVEIGKGHYSESFLRSIDYALQFNAENRPRTIGAWRREFDVMANLTENQRNGRTEIPVSESYTEINDAMSKKRLPAMTMLAVLLAMIGGIAGWQYRDVLSSWTRTIHSYVAGQDATDISTAETGSVEIESSKVRLLLQDAAEHMLEGRYVEPPDRNALDAYLTVLEISPGNQDALNGKDQIFQHYFLLVDEAIKEKKYSEAEKAILWLDVIEPNAMATKMARIQLSDAKIEDEKLEQAEQQE